MSDPSGDRLGAVPLFPLPSVVLFPKAILPLHIFEERYKAMTADALAGDKRIAMALLKPGWEKNYYGRPCIEPVVCVGNIITHERLPDGKYNFFLQGATRARIVRELGVKEDEGSDRLYRVAQLEALHNEPVMEIDLANERQHLTWMFGDGPLADAPLVRQFRQVLCSAMPTGEVADLMAFNLLEDVGLKQALLEETDVRRRVARTIAGLETLRPFLEAKARRRGGSCRQPGMN